jgi:hypothetical protein
MDKKCHYGQTDNGVEEREKNENYLPGVRENNINLVEIMVLKNQDDDKSVDEEEKELRRCDIRIPMSCASERYATELQRSRERQPEENKIHQSENDFVTRVLHFVRFN